MKNLVASLTSQTTVLFRVSVLLILVALTSAVVVQIRFSSEITERFISDAGRMDEFARVLSRSQEETVRPVDLNTLRQDFDHYLESSSSRLASLEQQSGATASIINSAADSIVFLQGAYGFREIETERLLRYMVDSAGQPVLTPSSQPALTLDGNGPVAERNFTGTAFVVSDSGALLTNRHVAMPWEQDTRIEAMLNRGMEPLMLRFVGYLPSSHASFEVELIKASDGADLAVLKCSVVTEDIPRLRLSGVAPVQGDPVVVMGYPTGLRSMLAQTGAKFIDDLRAGEELDFWQIAAHLAKNDFIHPLASQGIVAQITAAAIAYDAETTHGGSGGPVLDGNGNVVAVNAAIIPGYNGSNIGVPVSYAKELLAQAEINLDQ
jgi:S1-C subfamily serine protease